MTDADKIAAVGRILDSAMPAEQKLAAIREVLRMQPSRPSQSRLQPTWNPDDDPEIRGRTPRHRPYTDSEAPPHWTDPNR